MKQTTVVNIYNFIRMSHTEPSRFLADDFETVRQQLLRVKQLGLPATWALKYDALMNERYQALLGEYLDENDELSAWWEITEPLCRRAGVPFRDSRNAECYDDRVDSAYSLGYEPQERERLVDAYMADFHEIYGKYPQSIGSWVLDSVTIDYAARRYGITAACICRDQMGVDGFTLWGGWPNGMYFPSRKNAFLPATTEENQIPIPVFRLLGPDPIYNFEADVRHGLQGVYTLEPSWLTGRDPEFIRWFFESLTKEPTLGIGYAHVGQENNFLWENIRPGFGPQLLAVDALRREGALRVETMADTARWFRRQFRLTPPMSFQASRDWTGGGLSAQWYASPHYRAGLLQEEGHLRIRDLFLYREDYPCRYLKGRMRGTKSTFDALPLLFPQLWGGAKDRPWLRLADSDGREPSGSVTFDCVDDRTARAVLHSHQGDAELLLDPCGIRICGPFSLRFDRLPVLKGVEGRTVRLEHEGFPYAFTIARGTMKNLEISPEDGEISLEFGPDLGEFEAPEAIPLPEARRSAARPVPPMAPQADPADSVFPLGQMRQVTLSSHQPGTIRCRLDDGPWQDYCGPISISQDTVLTALLSTPQGQSQESRWHYRFARKDLILISPTRLDSRRVFSGNGICDLLQEQRGSLDYLDGRWRGTLEDLDLTATFAPGPVESVALGFLSHHRSGIVYPESVELYVGPDADHLELLEILQMPNEPGIHEIEKMDAVFRVGRTIGALRILARRHKRMPQWCCYRGTETVFTMADNLMLHTVDAKL